MKNQLLHDVIASSWALHDNYEAHFSVRCVAMEKWATALYLLRLMWKYWWY